LRSLLPRRTPAASSPVTSAPAAASSAPAPSPPRALFRRLLITGVYYLQGIALARRERPALVHANDYNTMWIALAAKLLRGSRVVYDTHELWPDRNGRPEWRPWLLACEWIFVRAADIVITASPGYAELMSRRYRISPPAVIRNIPATTPAAAATGTTAGPLAVYIGGLIPGRGLEPGIEALARIPGLRMRLIGPGSDSYRASLRAIAERAGVADRLELRPAVAPSEVVAALAGANLGLMLIEPVCRSYELTLPNKLFEYAAAGVPVLSSDLPVIAGIVREHELGEAVAPYRLDQLAAGMRRLLEPERAAHLRSRALEFAGEHTWARERAKLAAVYASAMGAR
jgi:glycosyltransferase involved in cell wall biosynthesis